MPAYYGETLTSSHTGRLCPAGSWEMIGWDGKRLGWQSGDGRLHGVGSGARHAGLRYLRRGRRLGPPHPGDEGSTP